MTYRFFMFIAAVALTFAALPVRAQEAGGGTICPGEDLRRDLDAADLAHIEAQVAATPNSKGRFWRVEKTGVAPSWLFGTMHDSDPRITRLSEAEQAAFDGASHVALEIREIADGQAAQAKLLLEAPELIGYADNDTLKNSMTAEQFAAFERALARHGLSYAVMARTKPWMIWATLGASSCQIKKAQSAEEVSLDEQLGRAALAAGKELIGLETVREQIAALDTLPMDFHIEMIAQLADYKGQMDDYYATTLALYLEGNIGAIMPTMFALSGEAVNPADLFAFNAVLVDARNQLMAQRSQPFVELGNAFIAVGALHLIGETGLVEQFRRMGYQVTRIE